MMNCQRCRTEIEELETTERLSEGARAHLSACAPCRSFHDERQSLKRLIGSLAGVSAPADFDFRLRARLSAAKETNGSRSSWRSFLASAPALGLAASFALLVAGFVLYQQLKPATPTPEQPSIVAKQPSGQNIEQGNHVSASQPEAPAPTAPPEVATVIEENNGASPTTVDEKNNRSRLTGKRKQSIRQESGQVAAGVQSGGSNDLARRPATVITNGGASPFNAGNPVVELPVRSASQPMRVFVDDSSGAKRTVTLEPVILGSQDIAGRNMPRSASSQGIW